MNRGWVKLHRCIWDNPRSKDPEWLAVWLYLLTNATHQVMKADFDGKIIELQPGQLVTGRLKISTCTSVHESKVKRILQTLKIDQQIDQQAGVKGSVFTVLNWSLYQDCGQQIDQRVTSDRPTTDQRLTTNKNIRTQEHKKMESVPPARPTIDEVKSYSMEIGLTETEAEKFFDHYSANGWKVSGKTPMKDWRAGLRNWKRRAAEFQKPSQQPQRKAIAP